MHAAAVTSSIMQLSLSKFHLAPKNFKLSCVQLMISSGSPLNVLHFSSLVVWGLKVLGFSSSKLQGRQVKQLPHCTIKVSVNNQWLSSSFCLEEVMEMITVLSDCYYCCVQVQCVCAGNQGMLVFIIQIHKIFFLPCFAREGAHSPPAPSPSRSLTARAVQILSSWCTPSHFLDPPLIVFVMLTLS